MICIFTRTDDQTTTEVLRWLYHFGIKDVIRINSDDSLDKGQILQFDVDQHDFSFRVNGSLIRLSEIDAVWYRKGKGWLCNQFLEAQFADHPGLNSYIKKRLVNEEVRLSEYLHTVIEMTVPSLGSPFKLDINKLLVLKAAREAGLTTPAFWISNTRDSLLGTIENRPCVTKPISEVLYLFETGFADIGYFSYTERVTPAGLHQLPEHLSPSFIQEEILKSFEARVFFLDGKCYAMAIFSQSEEQTSVDFRRYHSTRPNRMVPLRLKLQLEQQITRLFEALQLNTGSADFIVDQQGRFFFLEINPVGQFGWVSSKCNYYLEKQVAVTLRDYARKYKDRSFASRPDNRIGHLRETAGSNDGLTDSRTFAAGGQ